MSENADQIEKMTIQFTKTCKTKSTKCSDKEYVTITYYTDYQTNNKSWKLK